MSCKSLIILGCIALAWGSLAAQENKPSEFYRYFPQWDQAVILKGQVEAAKLGGKSREVLLARFAELETRNNAFLDGTDPLIQEQIRYQEDLKAHNDDALKQRAEARQIQADIDATPADQRTQAWADAMNKRVEDSSAWDEKIAGRKKELAERKRDLAKMAEETYQKWADDLELFIEDCNLELGKPIPLLSKDPEIAKLEAVRLEAVKGRIAGIQKAIELLGSGNPAWDKEYHSLHQDIRAHTNDILITGLDMVTMGLAEAIKIKTAANVPLDEKIKASALWDELSSQADRLLANAANAEGAEAEALRKSAQVMKDLDEARGVASWGEAAVIAQRALFMGKETFQLAVDAVHSPKFSDALYRGSCSLGQLGIIFVKGAGGKAVPVAEMVVRGAEMALLFKLVSEERTQMDELANRAFNRHQKQLELQAKLQELENEKSALEWGLERAAGGKK